MSPAYLFSKWDSYCETNCIYSREILNLVYSIQSINRYIFVFLKEVLSRVPFTFVDPLKGIDFILYGSDSNDHRLNIISRRPMRSIFEHQFVKTCLLFINTNLHIISNFIGLVVITLFSLTACQ